MVCRGKSELGHAFFLLFQAQATNENSEDADLENCEKLLQLEEQVLRLEKWESMYKELEHKFKSLQTEYISLRNRKKEQDLQLNALLDKENQVRVEVTSMGCAN